MDKMRKQKECDHHWEDHTGWGNCTCFKCGAETMGCPEVLNQAKPKSASAQWISCAERLPTEADADDCEAIWTFGEHRERKVNLNSWSNIHRLDTHWMPTGLTRPQPPEES